MHNAPLALRVGLHPRRLRRRHGRDRQSRRNVGDPSRAPACRGGDDPADLGHARTPTSASRDVDLGERVEVPAWRTFTWPGLTVTRPGPYGNAATATAAIMLGGCRDARGRPPRSGGGCPVRRAQATTRGGAGRATTVPTWLRRSPRPDRRPPPVCGTSSTAVDRARGEAPDVLGRARLRLAAAGAVATGAEAVLPRPCSWAPMRRTCSHPLERLTRDSQMLVHHVSVNAPSQERLEAVLLGSYRARRPHMTGWLTTSFSPWARVSVSSYVRS